MAARDKKAEVHTSAFYLVNPEKVRYYFLVQASFHAEPSPGA